MIAFAALLAPLLLLLRGSPRPAGLAFSVVCVGLSSSSLAPFSQLSATLRVLAIGVALIASARARGSNSDAKRRSVRAGRMLLVGFIVLIGASRLVHGLIGSFAFAVLIGFALTVLVLPAVLRIPSRDRQVGVLTGLVALAGVSLVFALTNPSDAFEHGRLRGIFENANTMGFAAFCLAVCALLFTRSLVRLGFLAMAVVVVVATGSRTSGAALLLSGLMWTVARTPLLFAVMCLVAAAALVGWWAGWFELANSGILRTVDSRPQNWAVWDHVQSDWLFGVGASDKFTGVAGFPFAALLEGGMVGVAGWVIMCIALVRTLSVWSSPLAIFMLPAICTSLGESWMLSMFGPYFLIFFFTWIAVADVKDRHDRRSIDDG